MKTKKPFRIPPDEALLEFQTNEILASVTSLLNDTTVQVPVMNVFKIQSKTEMCCCLMLLSKRAKDRKDVKAMLVYEHATKQLILNQKITVRDLENAMLLSLKHQHTKPTTQMNRVSVAAE